MPLELNNCCFCVELRPGSFILGYIHMVWNALLSVVLFGAIVAFIIAYVNTKGDVLQIAINSAIISSVCLILVILNIVASINLLIGLHRDSDEHIFTYLMYDGIYVACSLGLSVATSKIDISLDLVVINLVSLLLGGYCFAVVRSYYLKKDYMNVDTQETNATESA